VWVQGGDANDLSFSLPKVWLQIGRDDADRRLPVLLQLQGLRRAPQAKAGRLLRVLLLRVCTVPADPSGELLKRGLGEVRFAAYPSRQEKLLAGIDEIGTTLALQAEIKRFQRSVRACRPISIATYRAFSYSLGAAWWLPLSCGAWH
jgi:hypothetical protein